MLRFTVLSLLLLSAVFQIRAASWIQEIDDVINPHVEQFRIKAVASEEGHLVGSATYREKGRRAEVKINGITTVDGRFWPNIGVEVANELNGNWQKIERPPTRGNPGSATLKFYEANVMLYLDLEIFRPLIGKMRYGRAVLDNGAEAIFELKDLLHKNALRSTAEEDWDKRVLWGYLEDPLARGPFAIGGISFRDGQLIAKAFYHDPKASSDVTIDGTETPMKYLPEMEFWAFAILQVTNDPDSEWKTVGKSTNSGKGAVFRIKANQKESKGFNIGIDILRPMVGKFGYGRAVLTNGQSAAFELLDLLPPNQTN